jgi:nucleotide-binding universal stress UspA family protein
MKTQEGLFQRIFVPISSEFFPPSVFLTSAMLAQATKGSVSSLYVFENRLVDEVERFSNTYLSHYDREETEREIRREHLCQAEDVVFTDAKAYFQKRGIEFQTACREGGFLDVMKQEIVAQRYDVVVMGFEKEYLFEYRVLSEIAVPVWVEKGNSKHSVVAVCSNLAPNVRVPVISKQLAELLGWSLHLVYVIDTEDAVEVDVSGVRREPRSLQQLQERAGEFLKAMEAQGISVELVTGGFERETMKVAARLDPGVLVVGREQKQKGRLGLPARDWKKRMVQHCPCSVLFLK